MSCEYLTFSWHKPNAEPINFARKDFNSHTRCKEMGLFQASIPKVQIMQFLMWRHCFLRSSHVAAWSFRRPQQDFGHNLLMSSSASPSKKLNSNRIARSMVARSDGPTADPSRPPALFFSTSLVACLPPGTEGLWGSCRFCGNLDGSRTEENGSWRAWRFCPGPSHCLLCKAERRWPELPAPSGRRETDLALG